MRRLFSTKAPLQLYNLSGRYATALFTAALKSDQLAVVKKDIGALEATIKTSEDVAGLLKDRTTMTAERERIMAKNLKFENMSKLTRHAIKVISENGRVSLLPDILSNFKALVAAHEMEVAVNVVTAASIDDGTKKSIVNATKHLISKNCTPKYNFQVDPRIIGGVVVEVDGQTYDLSVQARVNELQTELFERVA